MALTLSPNFSLIYLSADGTAELSITASSSQPLAPNKISRITINGEFPDGTSIKIFSGNTSNLIDALFVAGNDMNSGQGARIPIGPATYGLTKVSIPDIVFNEDLKNGLVVQMQVDMVTGEKIQSQPLSIYPAIRDDNANFAAWLLDLMQDYDMSQDDIDDYLLADYFYGDVVYNPNGEQTFIGGDFPVWVEEWQNETGNTGTPNAYTVINTITGETLGCTTQNSITYNPAATVDDGTCDPTCNGSEQECPTLYYLADNFGTDFMDAEQLNCLTACGYVDDTGTPTSSFPFDEEAVADDFFDNVIGDDLGLDCLPENWTNVLNDWWDNAEGDYQEFFEGEGLNSNTALDVIISFIAQNPQQYPSCVQNVSTPEDPDNVLGCTDQAAFNYNSNATVDDGSCYYPITDDGEPFVPSDEIVTALGLTNDEYTQLIDDTIALVQQLQTELENCPEDQTQEIQDLQQQLDDANEQLEDLASTEGILTAVENTINLIDSASGCDSTNQVVIDSFEALSESGAGASTIIALQTLCSANDGITQADLDDLIADLDYVYGEVGALYEAAGLDPMNILDYSEGNYEGELNYLNIPTGTNQGNLNIILDALNNSITNLVGEGGTTEALEQALAALQSIGDNLGTGVTVTADNIADSEVTSNFAIDLLQQSLAELEDLDSTQTEQLEGVLANLLASLQAGGVATPINATYPNIFTGETVDSGIELDTLGYSQEVYNLVQALVANQQDPTLTATQDDVDDAYDNGFADGVNSVDITTDNQDVADAAYEAGYADGVASVNPEDGIGQLDVDAAYADGFAAGVASVVPEDGVNQGDVDDAYNLGYSDGYDAGFAAGEASVDITSNDQAVYDGAFADGVASVDITSDNQAAFDEGVASVDITTDNQAAIDAATAVGTDLYNTIYQAGVDSVTPEDGIGQADVDQAFQDGVDSLAGTIENLEQQIQDLLNASGANTQEAYQILEAQLEQTQNELEQAQANNQAWEDFLSDLDVGMSRLEKFLRDSYGYDVNAPVPRATLTIPENMSSVNPNFLNEPITDAEGNPDYTSIYVGDGTTGNSTAYATYLDTVGFAGNADKKERLRGFLNMVGRAKKVKQGFMNFAGKKPFLRADGDNNEEDQPTVELTSGAKTGLYLIGGALAAFGIYKLVNKK